MRADIWHNVLWSRYKGRVFSAAHAQATAAGDDVRFIQMAETGGDRVALGPVDLGYHRYPYELLWRGSADRVPRWRSVPRFFWRGLSARADFVVIAGYAGACNWAHLFGLMLSGTRRGVFCDSTLGESRPGRLRAAAKRFFFAQADLIFCYGQRSREMVLHFGARSNAIVIGCQAAALPDGYDAAAVPALRAAAHQATPRLLYVGRFAPEKNLAALLRAFARVRATRPDAMLRLVGDGPLRGELERLSAELGLSDAVHFTGGLNQEQLAAEYLSATLLVLPSLREPWGLVVNEALSYGCPVLVSDRCGCVPELVQTGRSGLSFDAEDEEALEQGLTMLLADPPNPESCLAVIAPFTPDAAAGKILGAIRA